VYYNTLRCLLSFVFHSPGNPRSTLNCDFLIIVIVNRSTDLGTNTNMFIMWTYIYTQIDICIRDSYSDVLWNSIPVHSAKLYIISIYFTIKYYSFFKVYWNVHFEYFISTEWNLTLVYKVLRYTNTLQANLVEKIRKEPSS